MDFIFEEVIKQDTEFREPQFKQDKPNPEPIFPQDQPPIQPEEAEKPPINPKLAAENLISFFDQVQNGVWFMMNQGKLRRKYFESIAEYDRAEELQRKTTQELAQMEDHEKAMNLVERYKKYLIRLEARSERIPLNPEEKLQLQNPVEEMMRRNPNFDIPPGFALLFGLIGITIPRIILYREDF